MKLTNLRIKNFRGIKNLDVALPCQVTLVAGRNNCGKSTLLEAVDLLACASDPIRIGQLNTRREFTCDSLDDLATLFYGKDESHEVSLAGAFESGLMRTVQFQFQTPQQGDLSSDIVKKGSIRECVVNYGDQVADKDSERGAVRFYEILPGDLKWSVINQGQFGVWQSAYCTAGNEPKASDIVDKLKSACNEDWLKAYLKQLDSNISDITTMKDQIVLRTDSPKAWLPLQLMGDGVNKIVKILGLMCSVGDGGVVCIDEVDNGLHHTAMLKLIELILKVAKERHVQVLMTTHNLEFMRNVSNWLKDKNESFGFLRMVHCADGETKAFSYTAQEFGSSMSGGVEIR